MKYELVVFDWDGTLMDSTSKIVRCMRLAEQELGLRASSDEAIKELIGLGLPEVVRRLYSEQSDVGQLKAMCAAYSDHFVRADVTPCSMFDGVVGLLENLRSDGVKLAVATGKSRKGLNRAFRTSGLAEYFDDSRCADETASKPDPAMLSALLNKLRVAPERALMVGDTTYDIDMAHRASMRAIGVSYGAHSAQRLQSCKPHALVHDVESLHKELT